MNPNVEAAIDRCRVNGESLLEDAEVLQGWDRHSTALALAVLAQEEFAKTFLLQLVHEQVLPWNAGLQRVLRNHECKHVVSIVMEWLGESSEAAMDRILNRTPDPPFEGVPDDVAWAINILRHEKLERFESGYAAREKEWKGQARKLAEGMRERLKQAALYISVGESGFPESLPSQVEPSLAQSEIDRAIRLREFVRSPIFARQEYEYLKDVLKLVFAPPEITRESEA